MNEAKESMGTVARVAAVLRTMAEAQGDVTITLLSDRLGLAPSTVHRLISLLMQEGLVARGYANKTYRCGPEFVRIAGQVQAGAEIPDIAEPIMRALVDRYNESCLLCLYLDQHRKYTICKVIHGTHPLRYDVQQNIPMSLVWGATARSILAFLAGEEIGSILDLREPSPTTGKVANKAKTLSELEEIRVRGYSKSSGQRVAGSVGMGAPFYSAAGKVLGSICLTIPEARFDPTMQAQLGVALIEHADALSRSLGHPTKGRRR